MTEHKKTLVVIVDDNADEVFLTRRLLKREGIVNDCVSLRQPEQLIQTLDHLLELGHECDDFLILLDINMPRVNGYDVLEKIRTHNVYKTVRVIMLSASSDEQDIFESLDRGSDGYIAKPLSGPEFFSAIENIPEIKKQLVH